jgi:predicted O-methyltransferase YrrM
MCGMSKPTLRRTIAASRLAPLAALPVRARRIARHDYKVAVESLRWLIKSREHHNYTYELTPLNMEHIAWFVSGVCAVPVAVARGYLDELRGDLRLRKHLESTIAKAARRGLADRTVHYGRRMGWYAIVRALKPAHIVETGTDKGLGTAVLAAALLRNAAEGSPGRVTTIDINPEAGYLVRDGYLSEVVDVVVGDSIKAISALGVPVDIFLHDSDHSVEHEQREFEAVEPKLSGRAVLMSDNAAITDVLPQHAEKTERAFLFVREEPENHWYPGDGIGVAWRR